MFRELNKEARALQLPSSVHEEGAGVEPIIELYKIIGYRPRTEVGAKILHLVAEELHLHRFYPILFASAKSYLKLRHRRTLTCRRQS